MSVRHCLNCQKDYDADVQSPFCPHRALPLFRVTERVVIAPKTCTRCASWAWDQHHRQLDPTGWKRMDKGELVHHPDCAEQRATKKGLGIPPS